MRQPTFLHLSEPVSSNYFVSFFGDRSEVPEFSVIQWGGIFSSFEEHTFHRCQIVLETVIDAGKKARAEGHLKHPAFELHRVSVFQSTGAFEHLDRGLVTVHLDDLGQEGSTRKGDVAELILRHRSVHLNRHKVGNNSYYLSFCLHIQLFQFSILWVRSSRP